MARNEIDSSASRLKISGGIYVVKYGLWSQYEVDYQVLYLFEIIRNVIVAMTNF